MRRIAVSQIFETMKTVKKNMTKMTKMKSKIRKVRIVITSMTLKTQTFPELMTRLVSVTKDATHEMSSVILSYSRIQP